MGSFISAVGAASTGLQSVVLVFTHTQWFLVLVGLLGAGFALREQICAPIYQLCAGLKCPDPRNQTCFCISCGWCIMNVCCPFLCPKFHPPFSLRIIIVKATRLKADQSIKSMGQMMVFGLAHSSGNPAKTTSLQRYVFGRSPDGLNETVSWNEPLDLVMYPADTRIQIEIWRKDAFSEASVGVVNLPVDAIFEPAGSCPNCTLCGYYPCPRLLHQSGYGEYRWPFVRGAPTWRDRDQGKSFLEEECGECLDHMKAGCHIFWSKATKDGRHAPLQSPPAQARMGGPAQARMGGFTAQDKFEAMSLVHADGMELANLPAFQYDRDVVMAAVRQNGEAIQFAAPELQGDLQVQRVAANVPRPMVLQLHHKGEEAGRLWAYFVINGLGEEEQLPARVQPYV